MAILAPLHCIPSGHYWYVNRHPGRPDRGALSCVFWTLTLQTTIKYVILILRADNRGEGGIFALYALIRRHARWLTLPAIIGGAALLADGIITPPISVSSAVEGLTLLYPGITHRTHY